ncbi:MAG TPA: glycine zipper 2TM domain-containing protein [Gemmatimonadales bacterium]|nr:glycine zipper 2TM domain-containing protein [Gemmatimonadales bacterium]
MTRTNWIALAVLTSAALLGACSPRGGQAGQPDRAADQQDQASDQYNGRDNNNRDNSARDVSDLPVSFTVPAGTRIDLTINDELSSRENKPGDTFSAKVVNDIRDPSGNVAIDAGSTVNGNVVAVKPAPNRRTPGTLTLAVSTIETDGKTFPIRATIDSVKTEYRKQPISGRDAAKVGVGAAAGAVVGQIISKNTKGTVIGAVVGGMAGAGVAAETKDMDIVLPDGAHFQISVTEPLTVAVNRDALDNRRENSMERQNDTAKSKTRTY